MKLVVGLGNPGATYARTRHNLGFRVVGRLAQELQIPLRRSLRCRARMGRGNVEGKDTTLFLPETFMNRSGEPVARWLRAEKIPLGEMLVVVDDLHLPLGQLRIRASGSEGGHQGLASVIEGIGSRGFPRLRLGMGAPKEKKAWEDYVLEPFRRDEQPLVEKMVEEAVACCRLWIAKGTQSCANRFNVKDETDGTV